jgi:hypothetical protein
MLHLRQSTASQAVLIGPFVDTAGAAVTGLTIDAADIRLSKNGANIAGKNSGGGTHDELGMYTITLDATDTNTVGRLQLTVAETGALIVYHEYEVLEEAVYDMLYAASALGYVANAPVNVAQFGGSNGTFASGRPEVNTTHWAGTAVASATVNANMTQISGDSTAADNLELAYDDTAGAVRWNGIVDQGTAQSATGTTLVLRSAAAFADDELIGATAVITGGSTGVGQSRLITDYVSSTDTATVATWTTTPTGTITYRIYGTAPASAGGAPTAAEIADAVWDESTTGHTTSGTFGEQLKTDVDAILVDTGTTLDGRIPAALVSGRMDVSVGAMAANVLTATAINNDAITAAKIANGAIDAATFAADVDAEILSYIVDDATRIDASDLNSKIDSLTFTQAGHVDANIQRINDVAITGNGSPGTEFGV